MGFASAYLEQRAIFPEIIDEAPDKDTGIIVVVPAYDEPGIGTMLDSLALCGAPSCKVEIIIVVNAPQKASRESILNNKLTLNNIERWKIDNPGAFFRVYPVVAENSHPKDWGVGMARKTGMDEAVRRFNFLGKPEGVILNLDADCTVESNYFTAVHDEFLRVKGRTACSIYFEHPYGGKLHPAEVYDSISLYELHLRYYYQALKLTGFPYVFHTVGSCIGVRALAYIKAGGMNRKQAGEDFYFIQKLVPAGGYSDLSSTTVYPSPRPSFRVPFGTGASIRKMTSAENSFFLTYNILAFKDLKSFFKMTEDYYNGGQPDFPDFYRSLPDGLRTFTGESELHEKIDEIMRNTSGFSAFRKRFFGWFNMFRIVRFLNHVHSGLYVKTPVCDEASKLLREIGIITKTGDARGLLELYRSLEKSH